MEKTQTPELEDTSAVGNGATEIPEKRYDVVIIEDATKEVVSVIGTNLTKRKADRREDTGWSKIDSVNFSVEVREVK